MTHENDGALLSYKLRRISTIELSMLIKDLPSEKGARVVFTQIGAMSTYLPI